MPPLLAHFRRAMPSTTRAPPPATSIAGFMPAQPDLSLACLETLIHRLAPVCQFACDKPLSQEKQADSLRAPL